jgi:rhodanese-related sulfurtransferase
LDGKLAVSAKAVFSASRINLFTMQKRLFLLFPILFDLLSACAQPKNTFEQEVLSVLIKQTVPIVLPPDLSREMSDASARPVLLDTRSKREYEVSHLAGARYVGYDDFDLKRLPAGLSKDTPIVVYCSVGYRSEKVGEKLQQAGYTRVRNLYGGLFDWVNGGLPVVDTNERATQKVHAYSRLWGKWLEKGEKVYE